MDGSYRQCVQCGKRALSIATRCPGCGNEFPARAVTVSGSARGQGSFLTPGRTAALLAIVAVLASARFGGSTQPTEEQSAVVAMDSVTVPLDTAEAIEARAESAAELLVARDWTNVRKSRSTRSALEAMLMPGDTVLADSLDNGWYRVALEGEVLGYSHRSALARPGERPR